MHHTGPHGRVTRWPGAEGRNEEKALGHSLWGFHWIDKVGQGRQLIACHFKQLHGHCVVSYCLDPSPAMTKTKECCPRAAHCSLGWPSSGLVSLHVTGGSSWALCCL